MTVYKNSNIKHKHNGICIYIYGNTKQCRGLQKFPKKIFIFRDISNNTHNILVLLSKLYFGTYNKFIYLNVKEEMLVHI